jgi:hypothetical protein
MSIVSGQTTIVLNTESQKALTDAVNKDVAVANKWRKCAELFVSQGVTSDLLVKVGRGEDNPNELLHHQINTAIIAGFSDHVKAIISKETKTLTPEQQETKRYWGQQVGSYFRKIEKHVINIEAAGKDSEESTSQAKAKGANQKRGGVPKSAKGKIQYYLLQCIEAMRKLEVPMPSQDTDIKVLNTLMAKYK